MTLWVQRVLLNLNKPAAAVVVGTQLKLNKKYSQNESL